MAGELALEKDAQRMCIYISESDRWRGKPLYAAILEMLRQNGLAGATVLRGVAGYGAHSRIRTAAILSLSDDLPLKIEVVDTPAKIFEAAEILSPMVREGLVTVEDVHALRYTHRYLNPLPVDKPVSQVMTHPVVTLRPEMSIAQAWALMLEHLVKAMPVVDVENKVVGMLTNEDLIHRAESQQHLSVAERLDEGLLAEQLDALKRSNLTVADVMSHPVISVMEQDPLGVAAARMVNHDIKRLPVVGVAGVLVGVVSRVDILRQMLAVEGMRPELHIPPGAALTVGQVMYTPVPSVSPDADINEIVRILLQTGLRRLIVVDMLGRPRGLIGDADIVSRIQSPQRKGVLAALRGGPAPAGQATAEELMSSGVLTASPDTPVVEAARQMLSLRRKWLVVVNDEVKAIGLVDRQILLRAVTGS